MSNAFFSTVLVASIAIFVSVPEAKADTLFFQKTPVKTASEATCLAFASQVAQSQSFQNTHRSSAEVAGVKNGTYVSITCVGRGQQDAIAVIMAVAPNFGLAQQIGQLVADKLKGITCFDSPC